MTPRSFNLTCIVALLASIIVAMAFIGVWGGDGSGSFLNNEGGTSVSDGTFTMGQYAVISSLGCLTLTVVALVLLLKFVAPDSDELP